jgi:hypothetical protein
MDNLVPLLHVPEICVADETTLKEGCSWGLVGEVIVITN